MTRTAAEESELHMSAKAASVSPRKSSSKQSHPVILLRNQANPPVLTHL